MTNEQAHTARGPSYRAAMNIDAERRRQLLVALANELRAAWDSPNEAHALPDWPADGCSQGCLLCVEKWLRARAEA